MLAQTAPVTNHFTDVPSSLPDRSSLVPVSFVDVESDAVRIAHASWEKWCMGRKMPMRNDVSLRDLGIHAASISLVHVLPAESDYEFRVIGDAHVQAYGVSNQGKRMSKVIANSPRFGKLLKASYDMVCAMRRPYAFRGIMGRDALHTRFVWFETCYLPLGPSPDEVDYVMNATCYVPRGGMWPDY
jgi:hypothetical protein